jgi:hypothetical protein
LLVELLPKAYLVGSTLIPNIYAQREVNEKTKRKPQIFFFL